MSKKKLTFGESIKIWYSYNYPIVTTLLAIIGSVLLTATMRTHIAAINILDKSISGFYFFSLMMLAFIHIFTAFNFTKKRSKGAFILFTLITFLVIIFTYFYIDAMVNDIYTKEGLTDKMVQSIAIIIVGNLFYIGANIFSFFIVNKNYKKERD